MAGKAEYPDLLELTCGRPGAENVPYRPMDAFLFILDCFSRFRDDLGMLMDYWSEARLNHHTEATSMLYAARECARVALKEGLQAGFDRHALASRAMVAGLEGLGLKIFGDKQHKMPNVTGVYIPEGIDGEAARADMLHDFGIEIGTSFGPLHGMIWRIGAMGYNCQKQNTS